MGGNHEHAGGHSHGVGADADARWVWGALGILGVFIVGEVIAAFLTGSLVLLSDAGHMLSDASSLVIALIALGIGARPARGAWTFGFKRAEIVGALVNAAMLVGFAIVIFVEAVRRLTRPAESVEAGAVLVVALLGVVINLIATWAVSRADRNNMSIEGAYKHMLTDLYAFIGTAVAAIVILTTGWERADAVASLVVAALMLYAGWPLLVVSLRVLMEVAPEHVDLDDVRDHLLAVEHVVDVHELHVWAVSSDLATVSAHVVVEDGCFSDGHAPQILDQVQACLGSHFDVSHSTFQIEPRAHSDHEVVVH